MDSDDELGKSGLGNPHKPPALEACPTDQEISSAGFSPISKLVIMAEERPPTTDEIRRAIDSGATGDKVDFPDPAAAPLGTDEEAAGRPLETARREASLLTETRPSPPRPGFRLGAPLWSLAIAFLIAAIIIGIAVWW